MQIFSFGTNGKKKKPNFVLNLYKKREWIWIFDDIDTILVKKDIKGLKNIGEENKGEIPPNVISSNAL